MICKLIMKSSKCDFFFFNESLFQSTLFPVENWDPHNDSVNTGDILEV